MKIRKCEILLVYFETIKEFYENHPNFEKDGWHMESTIREEIPFKMEMAIEVTYRRWIDTQEKGADKCQP